MATPDMDVIKEIPGYKVILKAILKSQIQQLVQQLASCTEEESVILTANVSDGTLCHLGSDSGKSFLEEKDDFKAQFLGFCLQRHNKKKQEEAREKERQEQAQLFSSQMSPRFSGPGQVYMPGMSPGISPSMHMPQRRSRPYPVSRPMRRPNPRPVLSNVMRPHTSTAPEPGIKMEPDDNDTNLSGSSQPTSPGSQSGSVDNTANNSAQLSLDSDLSGLMDSTQSDSNQTATVEQTPGPSSETGVKVENISESEFELEITGVELGSKPSGADSEGSGDSWRSPPGNMGGATGVSGDLQGSQSQQEYTEKGKDTKIRYSCPIGICEKNFSSRWRCSFHVRNQHGQESLGTECTICNQRFSTRQALKSHEKRVHEKVYNKICLSCGFGFYTEAELDEHMRRSHGAEKFKCQKCLRAFVHKRNCKKHENKCMNKKPRKDFRCDACDRSYKTSCSLAHHRKVKHQLNAFVCEKCGKSFQRKYSHTRHIQTVHKDN